MATPANVPTEAPQEGLSGPTVAALGGAAALAGTAAPGVVAGALAVEAQKAVVEGILHALGEFLHGREGSIIPILVETMEREYPGREARELREVLRREREFEREFGRRMLTRVEAKLLRAVRIVDPEKRNRAVGDILRHEQSLVGKREDAMMGRVIAGAEMLDLRDRSPIGAFWMLSESVANHTPGCVAMSGKFWPWEVLETWHPPLHYGCPCYLLTFSEAVLFGHMDADDELPTVADAMRRAVAAKKLEEAILAEHDWDEWEETLAVILEAAKRGTRAKAQLRFKKGTVKGGQFAKKGAVAPLLRQVVRGFGTPAQRGDEGRHVWLKGRLTWIPETTSFKQTIDGVDYTSPPGGTNLYRDGKLLVAGHEDLARPIGVAEPTPLPPASPGPGPAPDETLPDFKGLGVAIPDYRGTVLRGGAHAGGTTGALMKDGPDGKWLVKRYGGNQDRVATELLANAIYREMGVPVPKAGMTFEPGAPDFSKVPDAKIAEPPLPVQAPPSAAHPWKVVTEVELVPDMAQRANVAHQAAANDREDVAGVITAAPKEQVVIVAKDAADAIVGALSAYSDKQATHVTGLEGDPGAKQELLRNVAKFAWEHHLPVIVDADAVDATLLEKYGFTLYAPGGKGIPQPPQDGKAAFGGSHALKLLHTKPSLPATTFGVPAPSKPSSWASEKGFPWDKPKAPPPPAQAKLPLPPSKPAKLPSADPAKAWTGPGYGGFGVGPRISTGIILREPDGRLWIYEPRGHFGGYEHTFPKGGLEKGLTAQQNAHKELWEETGLHGEIRGYVGDFQGDSGISRYYWGVRTGGTPTAGPETQAVKLVTPAEAEPMLNRQRDKDILAALMKLPGPNPKDPAPKDNYPAGRSEVALTYPLIEGEPKKITTPSAELGKGYMTDALVANWDVIGLEDDNVLWTPSGDPVRVDQGGTFQFRAQGEKKPYGAVPTEVWTMLGPYGQPTGKMVVTDDQRREQAAAIAAKLTPERIDDLVNEAPFKSDVMREEVRGALKARVAWMDGFAKTGEGIPEPLGGEEAQGEWRDAQAKSKSKPEAVVDARSFFLGEAEPLNAFLRGGGQSKDATPDQKAMVNSLDSLTAKSVAPDDTVVWEEIHPDDVGGIDVKLLGQVWTDKGYQIGTFAEPPVIADGNALLRVTIPSGFRAVAPGLLPGVEDMPDDTVIVRRGARFRVYQVEQNADGVWVVSVVAQ